MEFLNTVAAIGTVPLLILLVIIFILILKNQKNEYEAVKKELAALQKSTSDGMAQIKKEFQDSMTEFKQDHKDSMEAVDLKISQIMKDYAEKTYVQEAVGGWRNEVREIRQDIRVYNERVDKVLLEAGRQK